MRIQSTEQSVWDDVDSLVGAEYTYETGFSENWQASLGNFIDENQSISELIHTAPIRERNDQLRDMIGSGALTAEEVNQFRTRRGRSLNYDALGDYASAKLPDSGIRPTKEIEQEMLNDLAVRREYYESVRNKASFMGDVGALTGTMQGAVLDPVVAAGFVFGPTAAVNSVNFMRSIGYTAGRFGSYAAGEEALIQAQVSQWKDRINAPYTTADVVTNIGGAALGGALIGAGAAAINKFLSGSELPADQKKEFQEWLKTTDGIEAQKAVRIIEEELKQTPDQTLTVEQFSNEIKATEEYVNRVASPDVEQLPKLQDVEEQQFFETVDADIDAKLGNQVDLELPVFRENGEIGTNSLREELGTLQEETTRLQRIKECLLG